MFWRTRKKKQPKLENGVGILDEHGRWVPLPRSKDACWVALEFSGNTGTFLTEAFPAIRMILPLPMRCAASPGWMSAFQEELKECLIDLHRHATDKMENDS